MLTVREDKSFINIGFLRLCVRCSRKAFYVKPVCKYLAFEILCSWFCFIRNMDTSIHRLKFSIAAVSTVYVSFVLLKFVEMPIVGT